MVSILGYKKLLIWIRIAGSPCCKETEENRSWAISRIAGGKGKYEEYISWWKMCLEAQWLQINSGNWECSERGWGLSRAWWALKDATEISKGLEQNWNLDTGTIRAFLIWNYPTCAPCVLSILAHCAGGRQTRHCERFHFVSVPGTPECMDSDSFDLFCKERTQDGHFLKLCKYLWKGGQTCAGGLQGI